MRYPDWKLTFTVQTDAYDKQLGAVISHNNKPIVFFSRKLSKPQRNHTTTKKELLVIVECLKKIFGILLGYEINVFSYHKNLVYVATLSESQMVMLCRLIIEEFGPKIKHIAGFDKIVSDTLSRLLSTPINKSKPCTIKAQCRANKLFTIDRKENNDPPPPAKPLNCTKRTTKGTEECKFQPQYIHFGSRIRLLHARTRQCRDNLL